MLLATFFHMLFFSRIADSYFRLVLYLYLSCTQGSQLLALVLLLDFERQPLDKAINDILWWCDEVTY